MERRVSAQLWMTRGDVRVGTPGAERKGRGENREARELCAWDEDQRLFVLTPSVNASAEEE